MRQSLPGKAPNQPREAAQPFSKRSFPKLSRMLGFSGRELDNLRCETSPGQCQVPLPLPCPGGLWERPAFWQEARGRLRSYLGPLQRRGLLPSSFLVGREEGGPLPGLPLKAGPSEQAAVQRLGAACSEGHPPPRAASCGRDRSPAEVRECSRDLCLSLQSPVQGERCLRGGGGAAAASALPRAP